MDKKLGKGSESDLAGALSINGFDAKVSSQYHDWGISGTVKWFNGEDEIGSLSFEIHIDGSDRWGRFGFLQFIPEFQNRGMYTEGTAAFGDWAKRKGFRMYNNGSGELYLRSGYEYAPDEETDRGQLVLNVDRAKEYAAWKRGEVEKPSFYDNIPDDPRTIDGIPHDPRLLRGL